MALEFSDFGLSPEEKVETRKKALESFANVAGPAQKEQQARERGQLLTDAYVAAAQAAKGRKPQDVTALQTQAGAKAAEMFPGQAAKEDALTLQGAKMREDIVASKQQAAVNQYETQTDQMKQQAAQQIANQAFEYGISAQQLALAQDSYLADEGLRRLYEDYEAGRVNVAEIQKISNNMLIEAQKSRNLVEQEMARMRGELDKDLAEGRLDNAKKRMRKMLEMQKDMIEKAAKASNIAGILTGVGTVAGAVVGGIYGGPAGGMAGAKVGGAAGGTVGDIAAKNQ